MSKSLYTSPFTDGFIDVEKMDCFEIPIAVATSSFNIDNYYYYSFYYSVFANWTTVEYDCFIDNPIVNKLGLTIEEQPICGLDDQINKIKVNLTNDNPVIVVTTYGSLFFSKSYNKNTNPHAILVNGFDADNSLVHIQEFPHMVLDDMKVNGLYRFQLTEEMFSTILEKSRENLKSLWPNYYNKIWRVKKFEISPSNRINYIGVFEDFQNNYLKDNKFVLWINNLASSSIKLTDFEFTIARRKFIGSMHIFFSILERCFQNQLGNEFSEFERFKTEFIETRTMIYNKLYKTFTQGVDIDSNTAREFIDALCKEDNKLSLIITKYLLLMKQKNALSMQSLL